jgi:TRAP-type C4-dicarboxylate transport system permease large subunit
MLAIPLFIFEGNLMNSTGITKRLIRLADVLTGHMYGNLAQVSVVLSTLMGGVSGSAVADAAMQSRILGPDMIKKGYNRAYGASINGISSLILQLYQMDRLFMVQLKVSIGQLLLEDL